ncbi:uncharacterized protein [Antedon mediterranea]|uniref:uncharacterized protein n=1 Tax=Antedon mediterranea TaxID=105859 RepID=UPI003AF68176
MKNIFSLSKLKTSISSDPVHLQELQNYKRINHLVCDVGSQFLAQYYIKHSTTLMIDDDVRLLINEGHVEKFDANLLSQTKEKGSEFIGNNEPQITRPVTTVTCTYACAQRNSDLETCNKLYEYRKELKMRYTRRLTNDEFEADWEYVAGLLTAFGVSSEEINNLKIRPKDICLLEHTVVQGCRENAEEGKKTTLAPELLSPIDISTTNTRHCANKRIPYDPRKTKERNELCIIIVLSTIFLGLAVLFFILVSKHNGNNIKEVLVILALLIIVGFPVIRSIIKRQINTKNKNINFRRRHFYRHI